MNEETRETFRTRTRVVDFVRRFFAERGFLEVETPMMQPLAGGARWPAPSRPGTTPSAFRSSSGSPPSCT